MGERVVPQREAKMRIADINIPVSCNECSVQCEGMVPDETTPLIEHRTSLLGYFFMSFLLLFLCVGSAVGAYLLIEDTDRDHMKPFPLIVEGTAKRNANVSLRYALPPNKLQLMEIIGPPGGDARSAYNFVVDASGAGHEGLGWDFQPRNCDNETLSVAFIGDGTATVPTPNQLHETERLFELAIYEKNLSPCHWIVLQSDRNTKLVDEVTKLLDTMRTHHQC